MGSKKATAATRRTTVTSLLGMQEGVKPFEVLQKKLRCSLTKNKSDRVCAARALVSDGQHTNPLVACNASDVCKMTEIAATVEHSSLHSVVLQARSMRLLLHVRLTPL